MSIQFKPKQHNEPSYEDTEFRYDLAAKWESQGKLGDEEYNKKTFKDLDEELSKQGEQ
jgi:hypothetical protein